MKTQKPRTTTAAIIIAAFAAVWMVGISFFTKWPVLIEFSVPACGIMLVVALIIWLSGRRAKPRAERPGGYSGSTNGFAIASLVLGLVGMSVLAIVFGHVSRSQVKRTSDGGWGLATAGLVLGYVELAASVFAIVYVFVSASGTRIF